MKIALNQNSNNSFLLNISIFYDRIGWDKLITRCILPFVESSDEIQGSIVSLSRVRGDHVKLFLITSREQAKLLAIKADKHIKDFIVNNKIEIERTTVNNNQIFCDFPSNTIHYGIYNQDTSYLQPSYTNVQIELSKLLIFVFKQYGSETIQDLPEIMMELFYSYVNLLKLSKEKIIKIFNQLLELEYSKYDNKIAEQFKATNKINFTNNKDAIISILNDEEESSTCLTLYQEYWHLITDKYSGGFDYLERNKEAFLISSLCDLFDYKERMGAYHLFLNGIKHLS